MTPARVFPLALVLLDAAVLLSIFNLLARWRGLIGLGDFLIEAFLVPLGLLIVGLYSVDGYRLRSGMLSSAYAIEHATAVLAVLLGMSLVTFVLLSEVLILERSRGVLVAGYLLVMPVTLAYRRILVARLVRGQRDRRYLFVGPPDDFAAFRRAWTEHRMEAQLVPVPPAGDGGLRAALDEGAGQIEGIVIRESSVELPTEVAQRLVALHFAGVPTYTLELFHEVVWRKIPLYRLNQTWLFQAGFAAAREPVFERIKRLGDILTALSALVVALPLLAAVAALIAATDGRPVLFRQERVGRNRVTFRLAKFRTMRRGAEHGPPYTAARDPRVTRLGRFLRATRLDELPQLWNVLRGDMSLIGPRAEWERLVTEYERAIPCYHFRHLVRPGITGWAQVNHPYGASETDTLRKLEYDLYYIRHYSFLLDATIALKTVHIMLFGKGR
jgi:exopolysaccharide biosynthesis polyprenyl glycosylphosphotransferase